MKTPPLIRSPKGEGRLLPGHYRPVRFGPRPLPLCQYGGSGGASYVPINLFNCLVRQKKKKKRTKLTSSQVLQQLTGGCI